MQDYTPYTDINVPDYKIDQKDAGRVKLIQSPEIETVEVEEIPNPESSFNGKVFEGFQDNENYEVENSIIRATLIFIIFALVFLFIRSLFKSTTENN